MLKGKLFIENNYQSKIETFYECSSISISDNNKLEQKLHLLYFSYTLSYPPLNAMEHFIVSTSAMYFTIKQYK